MSIRVVRDLTAPMRHEIHIGRNSLATDAPLEDGGEGSGPSPHDLFDASLGACKAITVLWYAKHKGIPVEGIEVFVERDNSGERAGTYRLSAELSLTGNLSAAQREELLRVAQKCPVHKLMTQATIEISTTLSP
ncbi:MAG TPA: OsmC family protein [Burkholderiales bacterium]|jgi:putative redox protein|nr:OsmC family protein [Burkholderiales bacterium]